MMAACLAREWTQGRNKEENGERPSENATKLLVLIHRHTQSQSDLNPRIRKDAFGTELPPFQIIRLSTAHLGGDSGFERLRPTPK